jgi:outer membrane biosynthesis protein TonB
MRLVGIVSTAVLSLTLGAAAPAHAQQEQHDQQEEQKDQPAKDAKKVTPDKPAKQEEKTARPPDQEEKAARQPDKNAKQEEKAARQPDRNDKSEEKAAQQLQPQHTEQAKPGQQAQRGGGNDGDRIPMTVTERILAGNTRSVSTKATTGIATSSTGATRSNSLTRGQPIGSTRKMFLLSTSMACIPCAIRCIPASILHSASGCSSHPMWPGVQAA